MNSTIVSSLFVFMLIIPTFAFAHDGAHEGKNNPALQIEDVSAPNNSIYVIDNKNDTKPSIISNDPLGVSLSNSDILGDEDSLAIVDIGEGEPMIRFKEEASSKQKHSQHGKQKQTVEKATHELVSRQAKGYKVAVGITIIIGLAFLGLSFFKIGEGSARNPS